MKITIRNAAFLNAYVQYAKENPVLTALLLIAAVGILATVVALCVAGQKRKAAANRAASANEANHSEEIKTPPCDVAEPSKEPQQPLEKAATPPTETAKETKTPQEAKKEPIKEAAQKVTKTERANAPLPQKATKKSEETKAKLSDTPPKKTKQNKTTNKEDTMQEKKKSAPNFYEEDETDKQARYSGKWVICRLVTDDEKDEEETYFFELHASNGEKLLSSEEYTSYNGALRGIETHKANILKNNFRIMLSKKGDYIFKLLSGKNQLLCMGDHYATRARCESAIESAKRFAKTAILDENLQDQLVKIPHEDDGKIEPPSDGYNGKWIIDSNTAPDGEEVFFFELFANNGERLLSSEEYTSYIGAVNGIETHKANISKGNFRISLTKHGDYIYKLLNANGQLLCLGEHYKTKRLCANAVESVKRFALHSPTLTNSKNTQN